MDNYAPQSQEQINQTKVQVDSISFDTNNKLGSGFSSQVYKGHFRTQQVAVKQIQIQSLTNEVEKNLLHNQIKSLKQLNHPNIANLISVAQTKKNVYICTEFCQGGDLYSVIKKMKTLSQKESVRIFKGILNGYIHIATKGILHRDMKTSNIMLNNGQPKIIDLGFSDHSSYYKPKMYYNVGSPAYMAPQSYYDNIYSIKSQIWSMGVILYEMLFGDTICTKSTYGKMTNNIQMGNINFPNNKQVSPQIKSLLSRIFKIPVDLRINLQQLQKATNALIQINTSLQRVFTPQIKQTPTPTISQGNHRVLTAVQQHPIDFQKIRPETGQAKRISIPKNDQRTVFFTPLKQNRVNMSLNLGNPNQSFKRIDSQPFFLNLKFQQQSFVLQGQIKYVKFLFRLLKLITEHNFSQKNDIKFVLIKMLNTLMKGLKQSIIYGHNFFKLNDWQAFFQKFPLSLKQEYNTLYKKIGDYAKEKLFDTNVVSQLIPFFQGSIEKWKEQKSLKAIQTLFMNKLNLYEVELRREINGQIGEYLSMKIVAYDYMLIVLQMIRLHKACVSYAQFRRLSKITQILNSQPSKIQAVHFDLINQKKRLLFN